MDGRKSSRQESEKAARGSRKTLENEEERRGADRQEGWRGSSPPGCLCYGAGGAATRPQPGKSHGAPAALPTEILVSTPRQAALISRP